MRKNLPVVLFSASMLLAAAPLFAQTQTPPPKPTSGDIITKADANGDGKVSKEEFLNYERTRAEQVFDHFDTNKDGFIDKNEAAAMRQKWSQRRGGTSGSTKQGGTTSNGKTSQ